MYFLLLLNEYIRYFTAVSKLENPIFAASRKGKRTCLKKKKLAVCEASEFGCCFDGKTPAQGPFSAGNIRKNK